MNMSLPQASPQIPTISSSGSGTPSEDDDPVIAEYDVYITEPSSDTSKAYVLQFPNRSSSMPYRVGSAQSPMAVRVKPKSGFMELDLSISTKANFDRAKGVRWSQSLREAEEEGLGKFGMSSGFSSRVFRQAFGKDKSAIDREEEAYTLLDTFRDAEREGKVLSKQVLGGQILGNQEGRPFYMMGTFQKSMSTRRNDGGNADGKHKLHGSHNPNTLTIHLFFGHSR